MVSLEDLRLSAEMCGYKLSAKSYDQTRIGWYEDTGIWMQWNPIENAAQWRECIITLSVLGFNFDIRTNNKHSAWQHGFKPINLTCEIEEFPVLALVELARRKKV